MVSEKAFLKAYRKHADAIFRHCFFRVFSRERAQELLQETFMRTWKYLVAGNEIQNLRAFLYRVANNLIVSESRKKKEESLDALAEQGFDLPDADAVLAIYTEIERNCLHELIQELDPQYRQVIVMRYIDGLPPREIAVVLGESANVVSVRINRGVQKLRLLSQRYVSEPI